MVFFWFKVVISSLIIAGVSELSKRNVLFAGVMASLPLVSLLSIVWLYVETKSADKAIALSGSVFWMVLPSLSFFLILPYLLKKQMAFPLSVLVACLATSLVYFVFLGIYSKLGIKI